MGYTLSSLHTIADKEKAIREAGAIVTGGGNTFALLTRLYDQNLITPIREAVMNGTPYIGWSAGANLACPTIMTTNDMPVVQPPSFEALNLVPFQINPHYHELRFEGREVKPARSVWRSSWLWAPTAPSSGCPKVCLYTARIIV